MPESGSSMFTDFDGYQAGMRDMFDLLALQLRGFQARLTWVELSNLYLLHACESSPRLAFMTLPANRVFITFVTRRDAALIYRGCELHYGDILFHSLNELGHQRTTSACSWGSISLSPESLKNFVKVIAGQNLLLPAVERIVRPLPDDRRQLLRIHAQARRIAETHLDRIANKEVARALEQELALALVRCLAAGADHPVSASKQRQAGLLVRLEALLTAYAGRLIRTQEICSALGVSKSVLRSACKAILGMSAGNYQHLRRLKLARAELMRRKASAADIAEAVRLYGFADLHRFVTEFWKTYGEMPPLPPHQPPKLSM
jgi:AraC-like DNA-binding protein